MNNAEHVRVLADKIKAELVIDNGNGTFTASAPAAEDAPSLYEANLPDGLTLDQVKAVNHYDTQFVAGATRAITEMAQTAFGVNTELNSATHTVGMYAKNSATVTANRDGTTDISVTTRVVDPSAGQLKAAVKDFKTAMVAAKEE